MAKSARSGTVYCSDLEWEQVRALAGDAGLPMSRYVMACLLAGAEGPDADSVPKDAGSQEGVCEDGHMLVLSA